MKPQHRNCHHGKAAIQPIPFRVVCDPLTCVGQRSTSQLTDRHQSLQLPGKPNLRLPTALRFHIRYPAIFDLALHAAASLFHGWWLRHMRTTVCHSPAQGGRIPLERACSYPYARSRPEFLNSVVAPIGHINRSVRTQGRAGRAGELPRTFSTFSPCGKKAAVFIKMLNAVVVEVAHEQ